MEKLTGVVLEKENNHIVVLTDTGEFRKVRITGRSPEIGAEVSIPVRTRRTWSMPKMGWIAAAAAVLLFMLVSPLTTQFTQPPETAVAWVSIDINPAIELTVSDRQNVMEAQAYNEEGQKILGIIDVEGMKVKKAVREITARARELGYIGKSKDNTVLLSFTYLPKSDIDRGKFQKTLLASARDVMQDDALGGMVQTVNVTPELREKAVAKNITPGKYAVLIEAVTEYKLNLTEKDMQEKSVTRAIADAGGQVNEVLAKAHEEKELDKNEKEYLQIASGQSNAMGIAGIDGRGSGKNAGDKNGQEQGAGNFKPAGGHLYVPKIRDGKDPESVVDSTYKGDNQQPPTRPNDSAKPQPGDTAKPPAQPGQDGAQPPDNGDRGGLQQGTGNYIVPQPPVDDRDMYLHKPNF